MDETLMSAIRSAALNSGPGIWGGAVHAWRWDAANNAVHFMHSASTFVAASKRDAEEVLLRHFRDTNPEISEANGWTLETSLCRVIPEQIEEAKRRGYIR